MTDNPQPGQHLTYTVSVQDPLQGNERFIQRCESLLHLKVRLVDSTSSMCQSTMTQVTQCQCLWSSATMGGGVVLGIT